MTRRTAEYEVWGAYCVYYCIPPAEIEMKYYGYCSRGYREWLRVSYLQQ